MTIEITTKPETFIVREIRQKSFPDKEREEFWLILEEGKSVAFHWLDEARSDTRRECEEMLERLCKALHIPFEQEEAYDTEGEEDDE